MRIVLYKFLKSGAFEFFFYVKKIGCFRVTYHHPSKRLYCIFSKTTEIEWMNPILALNDTDYRIKVLFSFPFRHKKKLEEESFDL